MPCGRQWKRSISHLMMSRKRVSLRCRPTILWRQPADRSAQVEGGAPPRRVECATGVALPLVSTRVARTKRADVEIAQACDLDVERLPIRRCRTDFHAWHIR